MGVSLARCVLPVFLAGAPAALCVADALASGFGREPPASPLLVLAAATTLLAAWLVARAPSLSPRTIASLATLCSVSALGTTVLVAGPVSARVLDLLEAIPATVSEAIEVRRAVRDAERSFRSGENVVLGFSTSELWLVGAGDEDHSCFVVYVEEPTESQEEWFEERLGGRPDRPSCIPPGSDAMVCVSAFGRVMVAPVRVAVAGCILDPAGMAYNERITRLLADEGIPGPRCSFGPSELESYGFRSRILGASPERTSTRASEPGTSKSPGPESGSSARGGSPSRPGRDRRDPDGAPGAAGRALPSARRKRGAPPSSVLDDSSRSDREARGAATSPTGT